jgi:hypothetical protein
MTIDEELEVTRCSFGAQRGGRGLAIALLLVLGACSGNGTTSDDAGGTRSDSSIPPGGDLPATPTASPGELVINVRDGSTDRTLRCGNGTGMLQASLGPAGAGARLLVVCTDGSIQTDGFQVSLQVLRPTLAAGTYALSSDTFGIAVGDGGEGFAAGATASNATAFTGTVIIEEAGTGPGSRLRGSFTISWPRVGTLTNGTVTGGADRPGGLAAAFDVTQ